MVEVVGNSAVKSSLYVNENWIGLLENSEGVKNCYSSNSLFQ